MYVASTEICHGMENESLTAGRALDMLRESDEESLPDSFFEVFVADRERRFLGTIFLDALIRARPMTSVETIMHADRRQVKVDDDRETIARLFERYNLISAPVTDNLVGTDGDGSNDADEGNIIAGHTWGIELSDAATSGNRIAGNFIGTNAAGTAASANSRWIARCTCDFGARPLPVKMRLICVAE